MGSRGDEVSRHRIAERWWSQQVACPDAVRGDPLARLVRQEVFKEMQQLLEEVEAGIDQE